MSYEIRIRSKKQEARKKSLFSCLLPLASCLLFLASCQKSSEPPPVKKEIKVIAVVNGEKITADEFEKEFSILRKKNRLDEVAEREQILMLKKSLLDQLIEKRLLLQEAGSLKLSVTDTETEEAVKRIAAGYPQGVMQEMLKNEGISMGEWRNKLRENMLIEKLIAYRLKGNSDVSDRDIDSYFKSHSKDFTKPLQAHVRQIVVKSEEDALVVRSELLKGGDFAKIAMEKSIAPEAKKGGDLGFFSEGQMPQEFDVIFKMKVGEIGYPVKTPYGYHIFKLIEKREARKMEPLEIKEKVRRILAKGKHDEALKNMITSLRENAKIEIKETM
ncbi:MAG: SurA N-terminal domain-containing protein [Nitrospinae bacterium]|nr:SurA N-terminal domain-containing protein [Nitrospinota bacterium]